VLPAAVLPEVLVGVAAHPALEHGGVAGHDAVGVALAVARGVHRHALEGQDEAPVGLAHRGAEHHRRAQAEREHGGPARRLGGAAEERDVGAGQA
jgi:hypothetical protein